MSEDHGALVNKVMRGAPADTAGVRVGDIIVEFDGQKIDEWKELPRVVAGTPVGSAVDVVVVRKGKRKQLEIVLGELPDESFTPAVAPAPTKLGIRLQRMTPDLAEQLGMEEVQGVLVAEVEPGSPAAEARLQRGDVILEVNRHQVASPEEVSEQIQDDDPKVLMLVRRGERTLFLVVKRG